MSEEYFRISNTKSLPVNCDFHKNHYDSIQTLRGIAAIFVVLEHIRFIQNGAFGVDIFFCISGFMVMFTTHQNTRYFFRKRLLRIIPFYYLMTLGIYILLLLFPEMFEQTTPRIIYLVKSLLFIPFDIGNGAIQPLIRIGWTINYEMFFYILFFIASRISHRYRGLVCSILIGLFVLAGFVLPVQGVVFDFYSNPIMLEFMMGILCYYATRAVHGIHQRKQMPVLTIPLSMLMAVVLFAFMWITRDSFEMLSFSRLLYWGLPAALIVLCFFTAGLMISMPSFSITLGNISFSLYLIHYYPIMFIDRVLLDFSTASPGAAAGAICSILVVVFLSYPAWYLIEHRLTGWLRSRFLPRSSG